LKVILGSATADLILLIPAVLFASLVASVAHATRWVNLIGAGCFLILAALAVRDARRLRQGREQAPAPKETWAFGKGVAANLANPLTWSFWLATGTPTMLQAKHAAGGAGLVAFTITWFLAASGLEAMFAFGLARTGRGIGVHGQSLVTALSACFFTALAVIFIAHSINT
jgi:threonine/homoserine/homoserine lactone efflux protein